MLTLVLLSDSAFFLMIFYYMVFGGKSLAKSYQILFITTSRNIFKSLKLLVNQKRDVMFDKWLCVWKQSFSIQLKKIEDKNDWKSIQIM